MAEHAAGVPVALQTDHITLGQSIKHSWGDWWALKIGIKYHIDTKMKNW